MLAIIIGASASVFGSAWFALLGPAVGIVYFYLGTRRYRRRRALVATGFPPAWREILERRVPFYVRLDDSGRERFETDVLVFLDEQRILASHGAELDDEARLLVAASAAMLGHGLPDWEWPTLRDIVVYPRAFDAEYRQGAAGNIAGMVHAQGPILISKRDLTLGFAQPRDGHNVALHELAHVMDFADGHTDGVPGDMAWVATAPWIEVVADRLEKVRKRKRPGGLRDYAGTNEAELFAVAVEAFFERPADLKRRDPELFELLAEYFNQDPSRKRDVGTPRGPSTTARLSR